MGLVSAHRVALTPEERAYAYTRTLGSIGLLLAYAAGFVTLSAGTERTFYLVASLGFLFVSLAQGGARLFLGLAPRTTLYVAFPADLVWIALATSALLAYGDAGYVIAIVWPVWKRVLKWWRRTMSPPGARIPRLAMTFSGSRSSRSL